MLTKKFPISLIIILAGIFSGMECWAQVQLLDARIIANKNSSAYWSDSSLVAGEGDIVQLSVALTVRLAAMYSPLYLSNYDRLIVNNDTIVTDQIYRIFDHLTKQPSIRWYRVKPVALDTIYQNYHRSVTPFAVIPYEEVLVPEWNNQWKIELRSLADYENIFPGTVWLKVEVCHDDDIITSPGSRQRLKVYDRFDFGGLSPQVFRVSVKAKTGSRFLDNIMLYRNLPAITNPESTSRLWTDHQTAHWIGGNLMSFAVSSARLLAVDISEWLGKLPLPELNYFEITDYYAKNVILNGDYYCSRQGEKIGLDDFRFTIGDIIIGDNRTALFYRDNSPDESAMPGAANGLLDRSDLIIECNRNSLRIRTMGEFYPDPISLLSWIPRWSSY
jgi:hypothetical protein